MIRRTCLISLRLLIITAALCWGVTLGSAQANKSTAKNRPSPSPNPMLMRRTTMAQRSAAAARNAARKAAAGQKNQVGRNAQREVRQ